MTHVIVTGNGSPNLTDEDWAFIWRTLDQGLTNTQSLTVDGSHVGEVALAWATKAGILTRTFYPNWAHHGGHPNPAGHINLRHLVRTLMRKTPVNERFVVLSFTYTPLENSTLASALAEHASRRLNAVHHHYSLTTHTQEF
jgi:hypothetical protein